jgi:hypothetical protein
MARVLGVEGRAAFVPECLQLFLCLHEILSHTHKTLVLGLGVRIIAPNPHLNPKP